MVFVINLRLTNYRVANCKAAISKAGLNWEEIVNFSLGDGRSLDCFALLVIVHHTYAPNNRAKNLNQNQLDIPDEHPSRLLQ